MISILINLMYGGENYDNFAIFISTERSADEEPEGIRLDSPTQYRVFISSWKTL